MQGKCEDNLSAAAGEEMDVRNGAKDVGYHADEQNGQGNG